MSENEIKTEHQCGKKALCHFLLIILGSFLGCLVALCLFVAALKPMAPQKAPCPCQMMHQRFEAPAPQQMGGTHGPRGGEFRHDGQQRPEKIKRDFQDALDRQDAKPPVKVDRK